jgi:hypothetical protein
MKWQRLTILDLMLLTVAYALAGGTCSGQYGTLASSGDVGRGATYFTMTDVFFNIVVLGNVYACPIILATQYVFRRRRTWLGVGEWLWLCPTCLWAAWIAIASLQPDGEVLTLLSLTLVIIFNSSCLSLACIAARLFGSWEWAPCRWTDMFGALACLSTGLWCLRESIVRPLVI